MPIRTRLTILYGTILTAMLTLFGAAVVAVVAVALPRTVDDVLRETAKAILEQSTGPIDTFTIRDFPNLDSLSDVGVAVQIINREGVAVNTNLKGNLIGFLDSDSLKKSLAALNGPYVEYQTTVRQRGMRPMRVLTYPIVGLESDQVFGFIQLARQIDDLEGAIQTLIFSMLIIGIVGVVLSAVAGAAITQRVLGPVDQITRTALEISRADDLNRRVPVTGNDEVGRMGMAFNEMLERLTSLFRVQQRLVADVSHELRTPLTVIRGNAELMYAMGCVDIESVEAIVKESERMTRMVSNLLLLSQADSGQLPMKVKSLDMGAILEDIERSANIMSAGRHEIRINVCGDLVVRGDEDRMKQVLLNLVDNAIKHTPNDGRITIAADCVMGPDKNQQQVKLSVSDSGPGIPAADLPYVFDRFYRVDKSRSRELGGAGLGLAIVRSIVEAHGGHIDVESVLGEGTTFNVWLPAYEPNLV
ncbi:MAG: cell wall metabolism sensor histidine kinase WalK [Anaerolineae bacterium]|nr:cell wall metabolism sensor histidine kinase WalK [Anaerolineae bacterium]